MPLRLVAVDMDGTFLDHSQGYDRTTFAQLWQRMQDLGVYFVVASGNQLAQLRSYFRDYPEVVYVAEGGAIIADQTGVLHVSPFSDDDVALILEQVSQRGDLRTLVCGVESASVLRSAGPQFIEQASRYYHRLNVVDDFSGISGPVVKFALDCPDHATSEALDWLRTRIAGVATPVSSGHGSIDLIVPGAHKGAALQKLGERWGVLPAEMLTFGDGGNDLEMMRLSGRAVAMGNAPDEIKRAADVVIGTNAEQAVLSYLATALENADAFP